MPETTNTVRQVGVLPVIRLDLSLLRGYLTVLLVVAAVVSVRVVALVAGGPWRWGEPGRHRAGRPGRGITRQEQRAIDASIRAARPAEDPWVRRRAHACARAWAQAPWPALLTCAVSWFQALTGAPGFARWLWWVLAPLATWGAGEAVVRCRRARRYLRVVGD